METIPAAVLFFLFLISSRSEFYSLFRPSLRFFSWFFLTPPKTLRRKNISVSFTPKENSIDVSWNFLSSIASTCLSEAKKKILRVPFKQGKHLFPALYNSNLAQLSPLTNCPRSFFNLQIYRLVRMFFPDTIQSALEIGQKS